MEDEIKRNKLLLYASQLAKGYEVPVGWERTPF